MLRAINKFFYQILSTRIRFSRIRVFPILIFAVILFAAPLIYGKNLSPAIASAFSIGEFIDKAIDKVFLFIPNVIHGVSSTLVVVAAKLFSWSIEYSTSGELYNNLKFINTTWVTIRDLINSLFIFIVLYIAFKAALVKPGDDVSGAIDRKALTNLVLAALLINFSLFFVKVAVDTSNVVSRGLYYRIETKTSDGDLSYGPVNAILAGLKLQTETKNSTNTSSDLPAQLVGVIGAIIVDLVTFAVFISISFMFIARIVVLIGVMIASPLLFVGMVLPQGRGKGIVKKIQSELYNQAVWPPIFLTVCFIVVQIIQAMNEAAGASNGKGFADAFSGDTGAFTIILNYLIIIGALTGGAKAARDMGRSGYGGVANKFTAKYGGAALAGAGAMAYRNAAGAGRWATSVGGEKSIGKRLERGAETSRIARTTLRLGGSLSKGTGDIRNAGKLIEKTPGVGKLAGVALGATGMSAAEYGKASTKTFASHGYGVKGRSSEDIEKKTKELMDMGPAAMVNMMERGTFLNDANKSAILSDKGQKARAAIVNEIKTKLKDDPEKQKDLLDKLFSIKVAEEMGPDNKIKEIFENQLLTNKDLKKELGKEYEAISKSSASASGRKAIEADAKAPERYAELMQKSRTSTPLSKKEREEMLAISTGGKNISLTQSRKELSDIEKKGENITEDEKTLKGKLKSRVDGADSDFDKMSTDDFMKLSTKQMADFQNKITKKHVEALSKVLEEGDKFKSEEDKKNLTEFAKEIRLNSPKSDAAKALTAMAMSGKGGFGEMNIKLVEAIKSGTTTDALKNVVSAMHPDEFSEALFNPDTQKSIFEKFKPDQGGDEFIAQLPKAALTKAIKDQKETHFDAEVDQYLRDSYTEIDKKFNDLPEKQRLAIEAVKTQHGDGTPKFVEAKKEIDKTFGQQRRQYGAARNQLKAAKYNENP